MTGSLWLAVGFGLVGIGIVLVLNLGGFNDRQRERNRRREERGAAIGWYARTPADFRRVGILVIAMGVLVLLFGAR